ncbi:MAG: GNAT family N-acetyltransferase [Firmicutes bacterium]|nr:GNAT family N-acetyltransferase [Bacillota bacterium]
MEKIEYRLVTPEEELHVARLQDMVFSLNWDEKQIREKIEKGERGGHTYGAIGTNGRVLAGMEVIPFTMWFDGQRVPMYGVGGVASAPESRRQGNIRGIFRKAFEDIYEKGAVFSHLYPFSHDYYRKFGYEQCGWAKAYTLPIAPGRKLPNGGSAHEFLQGDSAREALVAVYEAFASRHTMMISRTQKRWDEVFAISLFGADRLYYWKDAKGAIKAWVKFKRNNEKIQIQDIVWLDPESMLGMLQFIGMFEGAAEKMAFTASPEFVAEIYWNNVYDVAMEAAWLGMARVVNVKRALELMRKPEGDGAFTVKVDDDFAPWNRHTYAIEFGGGKCSVAIAETADADIETTERALAQMIFGAYPLERIAARADVRINGNLSMLQKAFPTKNLLITDFF